MKSKNIKKLRIILQRSTENELKEWYMRIKNTKSFKKNEKLRQYILQNIFHEYMKPDIHAYYEFTYNSDLDVILAVNV